MPILVTTPLLSREEGEEGVKIFQQMHANGKGDISQTDFMKALQKDAAVAKRLGLTASPIHQEEDNRNLFQNTRVDYKVKGKTISQEEFLEYTQGSGMEGFQFPQLTLAELKRSLKEIESASLESLESTLRTAPSDLVQVEVKSKVEVSNFDVTKALLTPSRILEFERRKEQSISPGERANLICRQLDRLKAVAEMQKGVLLAERDALLSEKYARLESLMAQQASSESSAHHHQPENPTATSAGENHDATVSDVSDGITTVKAGRDALFGQNSSSSLHFGFGNRDSVLALEREEMKNEVTCLKHDKQASEKKIEQNRGNSEDQWKVRRDVRGKAAQTLTEYMQLYRGIQGLTPEQCAAEAEHQLGDLELLTLALERDKEQLKNEVKCLKQEKQMFEQQIEQNQQIQQIESSRARIQELEQAVADATGTLEHSRHEAKKELQAARTKNEETKELLDATLQQMEAKHAAELDAEKEKFAAAAEQALQRMQTLQQTLERDKGQLKNEVKCLKQEKQVFEQQIEQNQQKQQIEKLRARIQELEQAVADATGTLEHSRHEAKKELQAARTRNEEMKMELDVAKEKHATAREQFLQRMQMEAKHAAELDAEKEKFAAAAEQALQQMQALQQTLERDKEQLKNEIECLKQEKQMFEQQIEQNQRIQQIESSRARIQELEQAVADATGTLEHSRHEAKKELQAARTKNEETKELLDATLQQMEAKHAAELDAEKEKFAAAAEQALQRMQTLQQTLERDKGQLKNEVKCLKQEKQMLEKQIELLIVEVKKEMQDSEKQMEFGSGDTESCSMHGRPGQFDQFEFDEVAVQEIAKTVYRRDRRIFDLQSQLENARLLSQTHQDESRMHSMENELHGILESVKRLQDEMKEADVAQVILQKNMKKVIRMLHDSNAAREESELMQEKLRVEAMNHLNAAIAAREEREQMGEQLREEAIQLANEANAELYQAIDVAEKAKTKSELELAEAKRQQQAAARLQVQIQTLYASQISEAMHLATCLYEDVARIDAALTAKLHIPICQLQTYMEDERTVGWSGICGITSPNMEAFDQDAGNCSVVPIDLAMQMEGIPSPHKSLVMTEQNPRDLGNSLILEQALPHSSLHSSLGPPQRRPPPPPTLKAETVAQKNAGSRTAAPTMMAARMLEQARLATLRVAAEKEELQELIAHARAIEETGSQMVEEAQVATSHHAEENRELQERVRALTHEKEATEKRLVEENLRYNFCTGAGLSMGKGQLCTYKLIAKVVQEKQDLIEQVTTLEEANARMLEELHHLLEELEQAQRTSTTREEANARLLEELHHLLEEKLRGAQECVASDFGTAASETSPSTESDQARVPLNEEGKARLDARYLQHILMRLNNSEKAVHERVAIEGTGAALIKQKDELIAQMAEENQDLIKLAAALEKVNARTLAQAQLTSARIAAEKKDLAEQIRGLLSAMEDAERHLEQEKLWSKENVVELLDENTGNVATELASPPKRALPSPPKRALEQAQFTSARFAAEKEDLEEQIRSLLLAKEDAEQQLEKEKLRSAEECFVIEAKGADLLEKYRESMKAAEKDRNFFWLEAFKSAGEKAKFAKCVAFSLREIETQISCMVCEVETVQKNEVVLQSVAEFATALHVRCEEQESTIGELNGQKKEHESIIEEYQKQLSETSALAFGLAQDLENLKREALASEQNTRALARVQTQEILSVIFFEKLKGNNRWRHRLLMNKWYQRAQGKKVRRILRGKIMSYAEARFCVRLYTRILRLWRAYLVHDWRYKLCMHTLAQRHRRRAMHYCMQRWRQEAISDTDPKHEGGGSDDGAAGVSGGAEIREIRGHQAAEFKPAAVNAPVGTRVGVEEVEAAACNKKAADLAIVLEPQHLKSPQKRHGHGNTPSDVRRSTFSNCPIRFSTPPHRDLDLQSGQRRTSRSSKAGSAKPARGLMPAKQMRELRCAALRISDSD